MSDISVSTSKGTCHSPNRLPINSAVQSNQAHRKRTWQGKQNGHFRRQRLCKPASLRLRLHLDMPARCLTDNCQNICSHFLLRSSLSEDMSVTERIDRERAGTAHGQRQYL